jgi:hypothetical protein
MPDSLMASSTQDLADYIGALRSRYARALQSDLLKLRTVHGGRAVSEALSLCREAEARASLSVSGAKAKQREQRADARLAQAVFRSRGRT